MRRPDLLFRRRKAGPVPAGPAPEAIGPRWLAESGTPDNPHAHLDAIVAAELSWGNRGGSRWSYNPMAEWTYYLALPFHLDLLRASFIFPPGITLWPAGPRRDRIERLHLGNDEDRIFLIAPVERGWSGGWEPLPLPRPADVIADEQDG